MNVCKEIQLRSAPEDKPALYWLLNRYSRESRWAFVATCRFERYGPLSYETHRIWAPTAEGRILFAALA